MHAQNVIYHISSNVDCEIPSRQQLSDNSRTHLHNYLNQKTNALYSSIIPVLIWSESNFMFGQNTIPFCI